MPNVHGASIELAPVFTRLKSIEPSTYGGTGLLVGCFAEELRLGSQVL